MKRLLAALLAAAVLLPGGGCCSVCPGHDVPVSLEGLYNFVNYFDKSYAYFPHSCPPCPYYGYGPGTVTVHHSYQNVPQPSAVPQPADMPPPTDESAPMEPSAESNLPELQPVFRY
jgi:hypothetical protein